MRILVCIKRVPDVGGRVTLTADGLEIDTSFLGFTISPHEECAIEEAVRIVEREGGGVMVATLGPDQAVEQLRNALALGANEAVLLETNGREWGPIATAAAIARLATERGPFDLVLFGNESADAGNYQVGVRVAYHLSLPVVTGAKAIEIGNGRITARREYLGAQESFEVALPAVITVKEGINLPRYPSLPALMRSKRATVDHVLVEWTEEGLRKRALRLPADTRRGADVLGNGTEAVPKLVALMEELGVFT
ncbi:MAG: electron transfer flavoprotein subunit beta/FixA family protein [Acidimicrobiales bacterium]